MTQDIKTVIWKERRLLFNQRGGKKQVILTLLVPAAMFAIVLPWQEGAGFFESPLAVIGGIFIPMLIVLLTIPESFAGERERHTLETLLASRLSSLDILYGKMIPSIALALFIFLITFFTAAIVANATGWTGQPAFYSPLIAAASIILSILVAVTSAAAGVIISLRSSTVKEAQQTLMAVVMFPILLLGVAGTFVFTVESLRNGIANIMKNLDPLILLSVVVIILCGTSYLLLRLARRRFQRSRLISD
jgi:ABC-2 type transport system permease protein